MFLIKATSQENLQFVFQEEVLRFQKMPWLLIGSLDLKEVQKNQEKGLIDWKKLTTIVDRAHVLVEVEERGVKQKVENLLIAVLDLFPTSVLIAIILNQKCRIEIMEEKVSDLFTELQV